MKPPPYVVRLSACAVLVVTAAACGTGTPGSSPRTSPASPGNPPTRLSARDHAWAAASHQDDLAEIAAGKTAASRGTTRQVRNAGKMLVQDHTRLDRTLMKAAGAVTEAMPTQPSAAQRKAARKLAGEHGAAFDKAFVSTQIRVHEKMIARTKKEAAGGRSWKLRALARAALPFLNRHLTRLRKLRHTT